MGCIIGVSTSTKDRSSKKRRNKETILARWTNVSWGFCTARETEPLSEVTAFADCDIRTVFVSAIRAAEVDNKSVFRAVDWNAADALIKEK